MIMFSCICVYYTIVISGGVLREGQAIGCSDKEPQKGYLNTTIYSLLYRHIIIESLHVPSNEVDGKDDLMKGE